MKADDFLQVGQTYIYMYIAPYKQYEELIGPMDLKVIEKEDLEPNRYHSRGINVTVGFSGVKHKFNIEVYDDKTRHKYLTFGYDERALVIVPDKAEAKRILMEKAYEYLNEPMVDKNILCHNVKVLLDKLKKVNI